MRLALATLRWINGVHFSRGGKRIRVGPQADGLPLSIVLLAAVAVLTVAFVAA